MQSGVLAVPQHRVGGSGLGEGLMQELAMHTTGRRVQMVSLADVQGWKLLDPLCLPRAAVLHQRCWKNPNKLEHGRWKTPAIPRFPGCGRSGQGGPSLHRSRGIRPQSCFTQASKRKMRDGGGALERGPGMISAPSFLCQASHRVEYI